MQPFLVETLTLDRFQPFRSPLCRCYDGDSSIGRQARFIAYMGFVRHASLLFCFSEVLLQKSKISTPTGASRFSRFLISTPNPELCKYGSLVQALVSGPQSLWLAHMAAHSR